MAITIDDLPIAMPEVFRDDAHRREVIRKWCALIARRQLPVTGFVNPSQHARQPGLLPMWQRVRIALGNHTWSHPRLGKVDLPVYLQDLRKGHQAIQALVPPGSTIPFRYPYLAEGFEPAVRDAIRAALRELESPIAPVTVDTLDWLYARGYTRARLAGDEASAARHHQGWLWNLQESTEHAEWLARRLFHREPTQILLLHANELNADHLEEYLDWLEERGYEFVTLTRALANPAYAEPDPATSLTGDSLWLRLARSRKLRGLE